MTPPKSCVCMSVFQYVCLPKSCVRVMQGYFSICVRLKQECTSTALAQHGCSRCTEGVLGAAPPRSEQARLGEVLGPVGMSNEGEHLHGLGPAKIDRVSLDFCMS